ncbi:alpha/beta hydrolase [Gordonia sp. CPCC 206044]|uniref:serine aminopeptidase domain-containing protein n=1 Tax=Gordonia sp. CPCC 206044 TaxID=3140793 RepID=UPI003AF39FFB
MSTPLALISPAMAVPSRYYHRLVDAFAAVGWTAVILPRRGIDPDDTAPSRARDWSYADEADDLLAELARLRAADPHRPIVVVGHSLGAQLFVAAARRADADLPDGFVAIAASVPWFRHYAGVGVVEYAMAAAVPVVTGALGYWPRPGFGAPAARTLMREWARMVRRGHTPFPAGEPVRLPTLAVRLAGDRLVTTAAAEHFESCIDPESLTTWTYTTDRCPPDGSVDHVRWVRTPAPVVNRIVTWWAGQSDDGESRERARRNVSTSAATMPTAATPIIDA